GKRDGTGRSGVTEIEPAPVGTRRSVPEPGGAVQRPRGDPVAVRVEGESQHGPGVAGHGPLRSGGEVPEADGRAGTVRRRRQGWRVRAERPGGAIPQTGTAAAPDSVGVPRPSWAPFSGRAGTASAVSR